MMLGLVVFLVLRSIWKSPVFAQLNRACRCPRFKSGISAVINGRGDIVDKIPLNTAGHLDVQVPLMHYKTPIHGLEIGRFG